MWETLSRWEEEDAEDRGEEDDDEAGGDGDDEDDLSVFFGRGNKAWRKASLV